jgi:hypothetical protein
MIGSLREKQGMTNGRRMGVAKEISEVAITLDFDTNVCYLDTSVRRFATRALKVGMTEITKEGSNGHYRRFIGTCKQVSLRAVSKTRRPRKQGGFRKAKVGSVASPPNAKSRGSVHDGGKKIRRSKLGKRVDVG